MISSNSRSLCIRAFIMTLLFLGGSYISFAQDITFNIKTYKGGYNVSCNGSTNGIIDATIVGGVPPYTYSWSSGQTTQDLTNIAAGSYTLTVTDALSSTKSKSITLYEPDLLEVVFTLSAYSGGYNISSMGGNDGSITTTVKGGAPPYKYTWSNGVSKADLKNLTAGTYSVSVQDQNGCIATQTATLVQPSPLSLSLSSPTFNGFNAHCNGSADASINLTVSGGMAPYKYSWSNGSFDEDLSGILAGTYKVIVSDANQQTAEAQIVLTQPTRLTTSLTSSLYSNGYNVSCSGCFNGSITSLTTGGISPYTYLWATTGTSNGATTANLSALNQGDYELTATDANGCAVVRKVFLTEPQADGWNRSGNVLSATDFLGSTNNQPLVFKTNGTEGLRLATNSNVGVGTSSPSEKLEVTGNVKVSGKVMTTRISPLPGDTAVFIGDSSIVYPTFYPNSLYGSPSGSTYKGTGIGYLSLPIGLYSNAIGNITKTEGNYSSALGYRVRTSPAAVRAITIGSGTTFANLVNTNPNSLWVGFNSDIPTLVVTDAGGTGQTGNVAIGTVDPHGYKLAVKGKIIAEEVHVKLYADWPDYVFSTDYKLKPIEELANYISKNKHLPNLPSAADVEKKSDFGLGEMQLKILEKVEEQSLYIIQLNERLSILEKENAELKAKNK
jgi:hypothetical protein